MESQIKAFSECFNRSPLLIGVVNQLMNVWIQWINKTDVVSFEKKKQTNAAVKPSTLSHILLLVDRIEKLTSKVFNIFVSFCVFSEWKNDQPKNNYWFAFRIRKIHKIEKYITFCSCNKWFASYSIKRSFFCLFSFHLSSSSFR